MVVGTWIGIADIFHNPGKASLAVLMFGLVFATFVHTSTPHRLWIASAYAGLMTEDRVEYVRETVEVLMKEQNSDYTTYERRPSHPIPRSAS